MESTVALFTLLLFTISAYTSSANADCPIEKDQKWSYNTSLANGPEHWGEKFPNCSGKQQSPINILTSNVVKNSSLTKLELENYEKPITLYHMGNVGFTVKLMPKDEIERSLTVNEEKYNLSHIQFHWGDKYYRGSEHTVDNIQYAFELHLIHTSAEGNVAIIAVLYESSINNNSEFNSIVNRLDSIPYVGDILADSAPIDLSGLMETKSSFYRYYGSLTNPGCDEGVIWSICKNPGTIGYEQLQEFRKLHSNYRPEHEDPYDCKQSNNFRPTQPLNGRTVMLSA